MCPLWNRSSSLASSGGITNRTGSNTEENYSQQSTPAAATNSSGGGFWGKIGNFLSNHAEGAGKVLNAGLNIGAKIADKYTGGAASTIIDTAKEGLAAIGDQFEGTGFHKFTRGLTNKKINDTTDKISNVFDNAKLNKVGKWKEIGGIMKDYRAENNKAKPLSFNNTVSSVSNGHVPIGYQASTSQGSSAPNEMKSVVSTGSTSVLVNKRKNRKKNKPNKKNKNKK